MDADQQPPPELTTLSAEELRALSQPDLFRWVALALGNWMVIGGALAFAARFWNPLGIGAAMMVIGTRQHALAMLAHDGAHYAVSRNKRVNDWLTGLLAFWPLFGGLDGYRRFHFTHHRKTGGSEDPEHAFKLRNASEWDLPLTRSRVLRLLLKDLSGLSAPRLPEVGELAPPLSTLDRLGPVIPGAVFVYPLWQAGLLWICPLLVGSFMTSHWAMFRLRVWSEHCGTRDTHRLHAGWLSRFFFLQHHTWLHWEHHRYPGVPSWNLPEVRRRLGEQGPPIVAVPELFRQHQNSAPMAAGVAP